MLFWYFAVATSTITTRISRLALYPLPLLPRGPLATTASCQHHSRCTHGFLRVGEIQRFFHTITPIRTLVTLTPLLCSFPFPACLFFEASRFGVSVRTGDYRVMLSECHTARKIAVNTGRMKQRFFVLQRPCSGEVTHTSQCSLILTT